MLMEDKMTFIFMHQLGLEKKFSAITEAMDETKLRLTHLEKICEVAWQPSKAQLVSVESF